MKKMDAVGLLKLLLQLIVNQLDFQNHLTR